MTSAGNVRVWVRLPDGNSKARKGISRGVSPKRGSGRASVPAPVSPARGSVLVGSTEPGTGTKSPARGSVRNSSETPKVTASPPSEKGARSPTRGSVRDKSPSRDSRSGKQGNSPSRGSTAATPPARGSVSSPSDGGVSPVRRSGQGVSPPRTPVRANTSSMSDTVDAANDQGFVRVAAPWDWKTGCLVENTASEVVVKVDINGKESKEYRLPADALEKGDVLIANEYPTEKGKMVCPHDLISLTHLNEPSVIECLANRYENDIIYTYTGPVLLALNPFHNLEDLYSDATMKMYWHHAEQNTDETLPPHVYAVADESFRGMMRKLEMSDLEFPTGCDQSILVSGESGSGKTVTMKFVMKYLAALSQRLAEFHLKAVKLGYLTMGKNAQSLEPVPRQTVSDPLALRGHTFNIKKDSLALKYTPNYTQGCKKGDLSTATTLSLDLGSIENQVLQSNPILESFGNARTLRNDNSSRFGKFIEMQFTRNGKLAGAQIQVYLLEKVRLVHQSPGERNFHVFFELMSGGMDFRELKNFYLTAKNTPADFKITATGTFGRRDGVSDQETYRLLRRAMNTMNFSASLQVDIFNVAAALLHASNLSWVEKHGEEAAVDEANEHLETFCRLLGVTPAEMSQSLCYYSITVGKDTRVRKSLSKEKAEHGFEALLEALYNALFISLVRRINDSIAFKSKEGDNHPLHGHAATVGILDIFGFESFLVNSLEQLCINYCNETLQMQFSTFILKNEQKEYEKEGIEWNFITFEDNQDALDLIESKSGILNILDDMSKAAGTTGRVFVDTLYKNCGDFKRFSADKKQMALMEFCIQHYAGPVEYSADGFTEKNRDQLPKESTEFLKNSSNEFVRELARIIESTVNVLDAGGKRDMSRKPATTVGGHFKTQLKDLRVKIGKTAPYYIRCLKPNDHLLPNDFETPIVAEQLRCGGILEAVRVARAGFTQHYSHDGFIKRYRPLVWREWQRDVARGAKTKKDISANLIDVLFTKLQKLEKHEAASLVTKSTESFVKLGMQMGKTKVFLRQKEFEGLERQRGHEQKNAALKLNATFRGFLVRCRWAEYVPLLQREKSSYLLYKERQRKEEEEAKAERERELSSLVEIFSQSQSSFDDSARDLVASKIGTRNPLNRAELMSQVPRGSFKWVRKGDTWAKKYLED